MTHFCIFDSDDDIQRIFLIWLVFELHIELGSILDHEGNFFSPVVDSKFHHIVIKILETWITCGTCSPLGGWRSLIPNLHMRHVAILTRLIIRLVRVISKRALSPFTVRVVNRHISKLAIVTSGTKFTLAENR